MSNTSKIKIIDNNSNETLYEFDLDQADQAYAMATQMEEMGLDIRVHNPSATETLADSLGIDKEERAQFEDSILKEIEDHD